MQTYVISTGRTRMETSWKRKEVSWAELTGRLAQSKCTGESMADYASMKNAQRGAIKDIGGFMGGTLSGGQRKACDVVSRSLVTLDIDYGQKDTITTVREMMGTTAWCLYSTHSHTAAKPRYRLIVPLSREVTPDEYIPIARKLADLIGIDLFDDSTYQPERLMYWPSHSRDAQPVFTEGKGDPLDADAVLNEYMDWRDVSSWPISTRVLRLSTGHGSKQEDPTAKPGIIGAFCRTYTISQAIETFLSDIYTPAGNGRYTYVQGSTTAGAISYEDKWLYSHHGTDPCCEREVNAFDMVRLHKFSELDVEADINTPVAKLPSFIKMAELASKDEKVAQLIAKEKLNSLNEDFAAIAPSEDGEDPMKWVSRLKMDDRKKSFLATPDNFTIIFENDPQLKGAVKLDIFHNMKVVVRDLPWRSLKEGPFWKNADDLNLITYCSSHYGISTKTPLLDAMDAVVSRNRFHPIRDYFDTLTWDGEPRLDTMLSDYLGAVDCPLTRSMCRKQFVAAVARVMRPGVKYDYVLTLVGKEGLGKSTLIKALGKDWFDDSFSPSDIGEKDAMEQLRGRWIIEMGELKDYKKSTVDAFKAFITKTSDEYRPAYGRETEHYDRECVFFATTNETNFLKGDTGNRRFWPVLVGVDLPSKNVFEISDEDVDQIWAEALHFYEEGERLYLPHDLEMEARKRQADLNEIAVDDRIGVIEAGLKKRLPTNWYDLPKDQRKLWFKSAVEISEEEPHIRRKTICAYEVFEEILGVPYDRYKSKEINQIFQRIGLIAPEGTSRTSDKEYGVQRRYEIPDTFFNS